MVYGIHCIYIYIWVCVCVCVCVFVCACVRAACVPRICAFSCVYACACVCVCVCTYVCILDNLMPREYLFLLICDINGKSNNRKDSSNGIRSINVINFWIPRELLWALGHASRDSWQMFASSQTNRYNCLKYSYLIKYSNDFYTTCDIYNWLAFC